MASAPRQGHQHAVPQIGFKCRISAQGLLRNIANIAMLAPAALNCPRSRTSTNRLLWHYLGTFILQKFHSILSGETMITFRIYPLQTILASHLVIGVQSGQTCRRTVSSFLAISLGLCSPFMELQCTKCTRIRCNFILASLSSFCFFLLFRTNVYALSHRTRSVGALGLFDRRLSVDLVLRTSLGWREDHFASMQNMAWRGVLLLRFDHGLVRLAGRVHWRMSRCHPFCSPGPF